jgi:hypothetical protein
MMGLLAMVICALALFLLLSDGPRPPRQGAL